LSPCFRAWEFFGLEERGREGGREGERLLLLARKGRREGEEEGGRAYLGLDCSLELFVIECLVVNPLLLGDESSSREGGREGGREGERTWALTVLFSSSSSGAWLSILFCCAASAAADKCLISASFCRMASSDRTLYFLRDGGREGGRGERRVAADK